MMNEGKPTGPLSKSPRLLSKPTGLLLDPKNDYVFKRLFTQAPELLVSLINAIRDREPPIASLEILNPYIDPQTLSGKHIVLDVLAVDVEGRRFNVEMQVQRHRAWGSRSLYYLAKLLSGQLKSGEGYESLRPVVGIHIIDFDYFNVQEVVHAANAVSGTDRVNGEQYVWCFALRDRNQPQITMGEELQLHFLELPKALRVLSGPSRENTLRASPEVRSGDGGSGDPGLVSTNFASALAFWVNFLKRWQEDQVMSSMNHPPVQKALNMLRAMSADEIEQQFAFERERALLIEQMELHAARAEGETAGILKGEAAGILKGKALGLEEGEAAGILKGEAAGILKGEAAGLQLALARLIASGMPEDQAREVLGLARDFGA
ncbi:MAG: Rpn family recombination-promoting nuclease/putative transposase [Burkholderiales bacterium]